jgi:hypothetical protein
MTGVPAVADGDSARAEGSLDDALTMLRSALNIIDASDVSADVGALLQDVIDRLELQPEPG